MVLFKFKANLLSAHQSNQVLLRFEKGQSKSNGQNHRHEEQHFSYRYFSGSDSQIRRKNDEFSGRTSRHKIMIYLKIIFLHEVDNLLQKRNQHVFRISFLQIRALTSPNRPNALDNSHLEQN